MLKTTNFNKKTKNYENTYFIFIPEYNIFCSNT